MFRRKPEFEPHPRPNLSIDDADRFGRAHPKGPKDELNYVVQLEDGQGNNITQPVPIKLGVKQTGPHELTLMNTEPLEITLDHNHPIVVAKIVDGAGAVIKEQKFAGPVDTIRYSVDS